MFNIGNHGDGEQEVMFTLIDSTPCDCLTLRYLFLCLYVNKRHDGLLVFTDDVIFKVLALK